jgi:hypothetical protein
LAFYSSFTAVRQELAASPTASQTPSPRPSPQGRGRKKGIGPQSKGEGDRRRRSLRPRARETDLGIHGLCTFATVFGRFAPFPPFETVSSVFGKFSATSSINRQLVSLRRRKSLPTDSAIGDGSRLLQQQMSRILKKLIGPAFACTALAKRPSV